MEAHHLPLSSLITLSLFLAILPPSYCTDDARFVDCSRPYECGGIKNVSYPFWGGNRPEYCGRQGFKLECNEYPIIKFGEQEFLILNISESQHIMTIARLDLWLCPQTYLDTVLNYSIFDYAPTVQNITFFYDCPPQVNTLIPVQNRFKCSLEGSDVDNNAYFVNESSAKIHIREPEKCRGEIRVPILRNAIDESAGVVPALKEVLNRGFDVEYIPLDDIVCNGCVESGGKCGSNVTHEFVCLCRDGERSYTCPDKQGNKWWKYVLGAVSCLITVVLILGIIFLINRRRMKKKYDPSILLSRSISYDPSGTTDQERGSSYFGVHLFTYNELEEATNNFDSAKELGDGGFGTVYYGILRDGRQVAVKRLYEHNCRRVEQFMNEVEILTRLRHPNLVSLYGCTSRTSRELLLVYEYIPNGTVADHLHGDLAKPGALPFPTRMKIAVETATALAYLHASDIIHRDVKTNNILLDNNFLVKVADFGLSRLFPTDVTHVSTAPQGTPGYVDPEYHECYQLTEKSDVFSFGVVLIELISSMPAVDISRHRHEINLSNMAMNKIQNHTLHELVDPSLGFESDCTVKNMITDVAELAFQCLQYVKEMRPSMAQVLEALKDIQHRDYIKDEEISISADDVVLLKSDPVPLSPDSALNWNISTSTTSNGSR
ncbi:LEAF RUST 10 DISEASE-RESISTANCE LOCUS RECEPTOR-LIKE PROTEIN KINASE-like 1.2 isoform X3 [Quercus lobata]|uniref:LEAF RUST 10 DISEASE-RESISTANCE LOCUS RECEPTOR-LIKE PROTEIN KINASE-like 1.2 isoform X3 n=1 Tax=Quercus lobata TaxID=97700 RepID=UPI00124431B6|nr:LEAF RUST 10 DISEASE-RESISTANCE LOCUS RECEPTOR-LIKE PROTEIN KINASE-like 1.2 isoform X3 [Quercus lobata]